MDEQLNRRKDDHWRLVQTPVPESTKEEIEELVKQMNERWLPWGIQFHRIEENHE